MTFVVPYDGKPTQLYRVRKTWKDISSQIGAYSILYNSKKSSDKAKSVHAVLYWDGKAQERSWMDPAK